MSHELNTHDAFVLIIMADIHLLEKSKASHRYIPTKGSSKKSRIRTLSAGGLCVTIFCLHNLIWLRRNPVTVMEGVCKQPDPATLPSNLSRFTSAPVFAQETAERLARAVKIPTMFENISPSPRPLVDCTVDRSFDDMGSVDEDER